MMTQFDGFWELGTWHDQQVSKGSEQRRRRKIRYPKGFDPENPGPPPDPERPGFCEAVVFEYVHM